MTKKVTVWHGLGYRHLWEAFEACLATIPPEDRRASAKTLLNTLLYQIEVECGT